MTVSSTPGKQQYHGLQVWQKVHCNIAVDHKQVTDAWYSQHDLPMAAEAKEKWLLIVGTHHDNRNARKT